MVQFEKLTLKEVWELLRDIPVNEDMEIDEEFLSYPIGTECTEIWHDLEEYYNVSIGDYQFNNN